MIICFTPTDYMMDPWTSNNKEDEPELETSFGKEDLADPIEKETKIFKDDFKPFVKLPDSQDYLASLGE